MDEADRTPPRLEVIAQATAELRAARDAAQAAMAYSDHAHAPVRRQNTRLSKITRLADEMATAGDPASPAIEASTEVANIGYELDQAVDPLHDAKEQVDLGGRSVAAGRTLLAGIDGAQSLREQFDRLETAFRSAEQVIETAQQELPSIKQSLAPVKDWPKVSEDRGGHAELARRLAGEAGRSLDPIDSRLFQLRKDLEQVASPLIDPAETGPGADRRRKELEIARRAGTTPVRSTPAPAASAPAPATSAATPATSGPALTASAPAGSPTDPHRRPAAQGQSTGRETGSR